MTTIKPAGNATTLAKLSDLHFDRATYQRGEQVRHVAEIVRNYDNDLIEPPKVSLRPDGTMWVVEGQQRCIAAERLGFTHIYAVVLPVDDLATEARLFARGNGGKKKVEGQYLHRARLAYGEPIALSVEKVLGEWGLTAEPEKPSKDTIKCIAALREAWGSAGGSDGFGLRDGALEAGEEALRWAIACVSPNLLIYPAHKVYQRHTVAALLWLARNEDHLPDPAKVGGVLKGIAPEALTLRVRKGPNENNHKAWAYNLREWINSQSPVFDVTPEEAAA